MVRRVAIGTSLERVREINYRQLFHSREREFPHSRPRKEDVKRTDVEAGASNVTSLYLFLIIVIIINFISLIMSWEEKTALGSSVPAGRLSSGQKKSFLSLDNY